MSRAFPLLLLLLGTTGCGQRPKATKLATKEDWKKMATMGIAPAVVTPPIERADEANLADDCRVVGVVIDGKPRAYLIAALKPFHSHVVNDLIGEVPVSVTYCDLANCLRVYTLDQRGEPIGLTQAGRTGEGLLLRYDNRIYAQVPDSLPGGGGQEPPLEKLAFEETTWKNWRLRHPGTDVYIGNVGPPMAPPNNT